MGAKRECPPLQSLNQTESDRVIIEFLASIFTVDVPLWREEWYKLTVAVTETLIAGTTADGLLYPTIPMSARADNLALLPDSVASGLAFVRAKHAKHEIVRSVEGLQIKADVIDFAPGVKEDGTLDWKGRTEQWVLRKQGDTLTMGVDEHGEYVARDPLGNIVDAE
jgi:hypothetical protein